MDAYGPAAGEVLEALRGRVLFSVVAGSTATSTIPGISIAGPSPEATVLTPTLDAEYLLAGRPLTLSVVPVSPEGLPTPAVISRAIVANRLGLPLLVVDAGCKQVPRVPHAALPSRMPGGRIDKEPALPRGTARSLYMEARLLGSSLARGLDALVAGETIPGGTTVAAAVMEALGYRALGRVSSSSASNPHGLRERVVRAALSRLHGAGDVFEAVDEIGDPVHVSLAGLAAGAVEAGAWAVLAGGTQMAAVLAILSRAEPKALERVAVATTPWIIRDGTADLLGLVRDIAPRVAVLAARFSMAGSRHAGLRAYEKGYVKEGVGAGGALVLGAARGLPAREMLEAVEEEYERITRGAGDAGSRGQA
ncbi:nicotinate mononucleotide-dependent phosphoribosyltransferase CobT [Pyrodictium occultum]|uniref:nicotinate mononucleotide-dependent phosphoribosyltransferase CobT n=1 Tax=Pyrodictium occultum TaxID=2309 RepID=UPI001F34E22D|nr:TIGR00303 family protein [Pyrodictium occultum]